MSEKTTGELLAEASCDSCTIPKGYQLPVLISLFAEIAGVPSDPQSLIARASCNFCTIPLGMQMPVLIDLANQILAGGGGGGGNACLFAGVGDPVLVPPCNVAIYFDITNGNFGLWVWIAAQAGWTNLIAAGP